MVDQVKHWHVTYNDIHNLIRQATPKVATEFNPDLLIAIGEYPSNLNYPLIKPFFRWRVSHYPISLSSMI